MLILQRLPASPFVRTKIFPAGIYSIKKRPENTAAGGSRIKNKNFSIYSTCSDIH